MSDSHEQQRISRRTIAKGAAWAVPAVPLVVATPAYAQSGGAPFGSFEDACKQPGNSCNPFGFNKGYSFLVTITNPTNLPIYIYTKPTGALVPVFIVTTSSQSGVTFTYGDAVQYFPAVPPAGPTLTPLGDSLLVGPNGGTVQLIIDATSNNSAQFTASGSIFVAWGHSAAPGSDPDHPYTPAPPAVTPPAYGEGWFGFTFSTTFPPCNKDNYCLP